MLRCASATAAAADALPRTPAAISGADCMAIGTGRHWVLSARMRERRWALSAMPVCDTGAALALSAMMHCDTGRTWGTECWP